MRSLILCREHLNRIHAILSRYPQGLSMRELARPLANAGRSWKAHAMSKTAALKAAASARTSVMKKVPSMPLAQRRRKIEALCGEVSAFWKDKPNTGAVAHLLSERQGKA